MGAFRIPRGLVGFRMHECAADRALKVFEPCLVEADFLQHSGAGVVADGDDGPERDTNGVRQVPADEGFGDFSGQPESPTTSPDEIAQSPALGSSTEACPTNQLVIEAR